MDEGRKGGWMRGGREGREAFGHKCVYACACVHMRFTTFLRAPLLNTYPGPALNTVFSYFHLLRGRKGEEGERMEGRREREGCVLRVLGVLCVLSVCVHAHARDRNEEEEKEEDG